jgi:hypothetical protein
MLWLSATHAWLMPLVWLSSAASCAATLLFAWGFPLAVAVPAVFCMGVTATMSFIGLQAVLQLSCAPALRGKVLSLYQLTFRGLPPLGALLLGWGGARGGLCHYSVAGALLAALAIAALARRHAGGKFFPANAEPLPRRQSPSSALAVFEPNKP